MHLTDHPVPLRRRRRLEPRPRRARLTRPAPRLGGRRPVTNEDDHDLKEMAKEKLKSLEEQKPLLEEKIKLKLIPPDPLDEKNIIVEIRNGVGGDEASLFVADLYEMYARFARRNFRRRIRCAVG